MSSALSRTSAPITTSTSMATDIMSSFQTTTAPVPSSTNQITATTLTGTQATIPNIPTTLPAERCGLGILVPQTPHPACAMQATNNSLHYLEMCCNGAARVLYNEGCDVFCEARNQTLKDLGECLHRLYDLRVDGQIDCNRGGASYSSLLPEETASTTSSMMAGASSASSPTGTASAAAANRMVEFGFQGVSPAGWATVLVLVASGVFGAFL